MNLEEPSLSANEYKSMVGSNAIFHILALASSEDPSGFYHGDNALSMIEISNALNDLIYRDGIVLKGVNNGTTSAAVSVGWTRKHGDKLPAVAFWKSYLLADVDQNGIPFWLPKAIESGQIDPSALVKKLYTLVESEITWE